MVKIHVIRCKNRKYSKQFEALQHGLAKHFAAEDLEITYEKTEEKKFEVYVDGELAFSQTNGDGKLDTGDKVARIFQTVRMASNRRKSVSVIPSGFMMPKAFTRSNSMPASSGFVSLKL